MKKHDEGRRAFLVGTAAGAAATVALVPDALAKSGQQVAAADAPAGGMAGMAMDAANAMAPMSDAHGAFFNADDSRTIKAFAERLMPGAPGKPGATDADVLNYIDLALSGAYKDQQEFYRHGLAQLDAHCKQPTARHSRILPAAQQDEVDRRARSRARRRNSSGRRRRRFSTPCARTRWKACSPTRSMAATKTSRAGGWSAFPARRCSSTRRRTCKARRPSRASPLSACSRSPNRKKG